MAVFGRFNSLQELIQYNSQHDPLSRFVNSILNKLTGTALTGAESEANAFTSRENAIAREFSASQVQQQLDFQERMANTQYQRAVADMQAAGVNPALAMSQGGNVSPSGAAASSSGISSVSPRSGLSMSEIVALATLKPQIDMIRAQAEDYKAAAELKKSQAAGQVITNEWLPKTLAASIGLQESTVAKYSAEIESIVASTEGQRLANEWNPKLWQNTLDNGTVNRQATIVGIQKVLNEIKVLQAQEANIMEDTRVKQVTQGLVIAQTVLAQQNSRDVSASAWRKEFENAFTEAYGHKPDEPIWNSVTSILGEWSGKMREGAVGFKELVSSVWNKVINYDPYSFGARHFESDRKD